MARSNWYKYRSYYKLLISTGIRSSKQARISALQILLEDHKDSVDQIGYGNNERENIL